MALRPQQEKFCQEYILDTNGRRAYKAAYPYCKTDQTADANASRLLSDARVKARVQELQAKAAEGCILDARQTLEEVAKLAVATLDDFVVVGEDGEPRLDFTRAPLYAVQELTSEVYMEGKGENAVPVKRTKFKLYSRLDALEKLMKHHGQYESDNRQRGAADAGRVAEIIALMDKAARARR